MFQRLSLLIAAALVMINAKGQGPANATPMLNKADAGQTFQRQQSVTNFVQAVANNLTNTSKNVQLKASIFALNWKDSATKYASEYYLNHTFQRHTQVVLGGGLDGNSNFNAFSAGFSHDFLHHNDVTEVNTYNADMQPIYDLLNSINASAIDDIQKADSATFVMAILNEANRMIAQRDGSDFEDAIIQKTIPAANRESALNEDSTLLTFYNAVKQDVAVSISKNPAPGLNATNNDIRMLAALIAVQYYTQPLTLALNGYLTSIMKSGKAPSGPPDNVDPETFNRYIAAVNKGIQAKASALPGKNITQVYTYIQQQYTKHVNAIKLRPSLTLDYNYTYNTSIIQNQHNVSLTLLWGFYCKNPNHPWELNLAVSDSATTDTTHLTTNHNVYTGQLGISKVFASDDNGAALFEANLTLEYDHTTSSTYKKNNRDNYFPTLTLQARPSAKSPWISIAAKRDMNHANFLGFLNVTFNLTNPNGGSDKGAGAN
ncbi:MAG TPA: hypothetical protein VMH27_09750 [Puia sp.]|nr:hypothetical protein [Puia sp.]